MKLAIALTIVSLVSTVVCSQTMNTTDSDSVNRRNVDSDIETYGRSGMDLKGKLKQYFAIEAAELNPYQSVVCSPLSALLPLGKMALAAEKTTTMELLTAVGARTRETLKTEFKKLISSLKRLPGVSLDIASRIYVSMDSRLNNKFHKETKSVFGSSCEKINMKNSQQAARTINDWVKNETHNMIPNLIQPDQISPSSSVILVNAVYFKAQWVNPFLNTAPGPFYGHSGVQQLTMMSRIGHYKYVKSDALDSQILSLPYQGGCSSFVIVLPNARDGLTVLLKALKVAPELLDKALKQMKNEGVSVTIPKFKVETKLNLETLYKKIGVKAIFDSKLGLKGMVDNEVVLVSTAIQKAVIEVTETGTTAAAASAVVGIDSSLVKKFVTADHPFFFYLMCKGEQLFSGTFVQHSIY